MSVPTRSRIEKRTIVNASKRPSKSVACPISARLTTLAETRVRKIAIRTSNSFWVVLREASRLQCSVASSCARIDGETSSFGVVGRSASRHGASSTSLTWRPEARF